MGLLVFKKGDNKFISAHFMIKEFECQCNYAECTTTKIEQMLIELLDGIRKVIKDAIGHEFPIKISSGYRCEAHNADTPGAVKGSQHPQGKAADIIIPNKYHSIVDAYVGDRGGVGFYEDRVHVDVRGSKARWNNKLSSIGV